MNNILIMPQNAEQLQVIEAVLNALKIRFVHTPSTTFEEFEEPDAQDRKSVV